MCSHSKGYTLPLVGGSDLQKLCPVCEATSRIRPENIPPQYRCPPLLRADPDWEGDLEHATRLDDTQRHRVLTYNKVQRNGDTGRYCMCKMVAGNEGAAPLVRLSNGKEMPAFALGTKMDLLTLDTQEYSVTMAASWGIDAGYRHFDTAAVFNSELQVGWAVNAKMQEGAVRREELFITTKLSNKAHARGAVVPAVRASLRDLNLYYVDLFVMHWPLATTGWLNKLESTDYLETWEGMIEARDRGLVRSLGVAHFNRHQLVRLIDASKDPPVVLQAEINLNLQQPELLEFCCAHDIVVMALSPFGSLFPQRAAAGAPPPRADHPALLRIARKHNRSVPQVVLRYLVELGVVPIPHSLRQAHVEENIQIYDFELTQQDRDVLKKFDCGYRTVDPDYMRNSPYYPFRKKSQ